MNPAPSTRASLLIRLRDPRDHAAWVEFVDIYEPLTYRLLRRYGLQDADAAEIMQELFLAVSRRSSAGTLRQNAALSRLVSGGWPETW